MKHLKTIFIVCICIIAVIGKHQSKKAIQSGCAEVKQINNK